VSSPFDFSGYGRPDPPTAAVPTPGGPGAPMPTTGFDPFAGAAPPPPQPHTGGGAFGGPGMVAAPSTLEVTRPPLFLFAVAFGVALVGAVIAGVWGAAILAALGGWLLAGPLAIGVLAAFTHVDTRRRARAVYSAPTWVSTLYWAVLACCAVGIGIGAWRIAMWAGKL
jgi:hypothetical protein